MEIYYSLDEASKPTHNNKFYTEEDAFEAAQLAATAFKQHIKVYLWRENRKVEYASVNPDGSVDLLVSALTQAAYNLEARGLLDEAKELQAVVGEAKKIYTFSAGTQVRVGKQVVAAKLDLALEVDKDTVQVKAFKINGVNELPESHAALQKELQAHYKTNSEPAIEAVRLVSEFLGNMKKFPLIYEMDEAKKFGLI